MHIEILSCSATASAVAGTAAAALTGDSLTIKNANKARKTSILHAWHTVQSAGFGQIAFPSGHDTTRGFRYPAAVGVNLTCLPLGHAINVQPQELLAVTLGAAATAGDVDTLSMIVRYEDLPGIEARGISASTLESRREKLTTVYASIVTSAGPAYSGEELLTSESDLLMANRDYAVLGFSSQTAVHAITLKGPDLGNVRIGCPGTLRPEITTQFFPLLARIHNEPIIPVISSGNKASTYIGCATDENAGTFVVGVHLALLR
jgi:hypothetical protein